jgi:uncharacterized cupredoxin-like copper-binding protein
MPLPSGVAQDKERLMKRLSVLLILLTFALAACGGGDDGGDGTISVVLDDFSFAPSSVTATAGTDVTVTASNIGGIQHSWVLLNEGEEVTTTAEITDDRVLASSADLEPGQSESVTFTAPAPGTYQIVCHISGHTEAGMTGTLTVGD